MSWVCLYLRKSANWHRYSSTIPEMSTPALGEGCWNGQGHFPNDHALSPVDVPSDKLDSALSAAEAAGFDRLQELEANAHRESERQIDR